jgi:hypothetical protein
LKFGWWARRKKTVPYRHMFGPPWQLPTNLPSRVEAVFMEGLRDPAGLKGINLGAERDAWDVELALRIYPREVVEALYPGNFL